MKKWITSAAIFAAAFFPQAAHAAEGAGAEHGSWTLLMFFAINFALFVWVLVRFAGPVARKFFADRAATIRTALSRAASALAEAEDLANKAAARMAALAAELKKLGDELEQETAFQVAKVAEMAKSTAEQNSSRHRDEQFRAVRRGASGACARSLPNRPRPSRAI